MYIPPWRKNRAPLVSNPYMGIAYHYTGAAYLSTGAAYPYTGAAYLYTGAAYPYTGAAYPYTGAAYPYIGRPFWTVTSFPSFFLFITTHFASCTWSGNAEMAELYVVIRIGGICTG
ncbi:hypothetical protein POVWA2_027180 [Plasmodium ovale wallikeri]|uniref:Uncharacterized protein n=1 Tax=Plasmodium ovale wallikeri TaxID=864142 RepID=A0A1A8YW42_PLAOA|nr:hypothetical protein POVWA1_029180 [Plasmodium ovale wallikeri]SBT35883.1 hypothetical protein POVWA2_027180 [Plasmodium ovale wallikeri]